jgi:hypothetical protein
VLFRAKFRDALRQTELFEQVPAEVWMQDWVVHCQPVGDGARALKYLAPYIFRVAISNRRILSLEDDQVTFSYTDARSGQRKTCTVSAGVYPAFPATLLQGFTRVAATVSTAQTSEITDKVQRLLLMPSTPTRETALSAIVGRRRPYMSWLRQADTVGHQYSAGKSLPLKQTAI